MLPPGYRNIVKLIVKHLFKGSLVALLYFERFKFGDLILIRQIRQKFSPRQSSSFTVHIIVI